MSIINIVVEKDRALIGVDTLAGFMAEAQGKGLPAYVDRHSLKLSLFPHINMAMTQRGDGNISTIARVMLEHELPKDFDHAVELMPAIMPQAYAQAMADRKARYGMETFEGSEVMLVGWSSSKGRFDAARWRRYPEDPDFVTLEVGPMLVAPEINLIEPVDVPDTPEKMEAVARRQVAWTRREHPSYTVGGRLLLAELTRDAVTVRTIADLG